MYCYDEKAKQAAMKKLGKTSEITRFKGLSEISPEEFEKFIKDGLRLSPVLLSTDIRIQKLLEYYMGNNTMERQQFIIENLRIEIDAVDMTQEELVELGEEEE